MLTRLLAIRRLRERRLHAQQQVACRQLADMQRQQRDLLAAQRRLQRAWRRHGVVGYVLDRAAWQRFRAELADYDLRDRELAGQLGTLQTGMQSLQATEAGLRARLRKAQRGQHKLQLLLEKT